MSLQQQIFIPLFLISLAVLLGDLYRKARLVALGAPEARWRGLGPATASMLHYAFAQARVLRQGFGVNHFLIFWAFIALLLVNAEFIVSGFVPTVRLSLLPDSLYLPVRAISDLMAGVTGVTVVLALIRRSCFPPYREARTVEAFAILTLVGLHMVGYLGVSAAEIALGHERAGGVMPIARSVAALLPTAGTATLELFWWLHAAALLTFVAILIPFTKHLHVITSIINCSLVRDGQPNTQPREEFRPDAVYGAGAVQQLSWKDLLDAFACTKCGRCQNVCPASETGKPLNPRLLIDEIRHNLLHNGPALRRGAPADLPLIGEDGPGSVPVGAIWACTSCGACMEVCPVFIEHLPKLVKLRRHLVQMEARFPEELLNLFENSEQRSNPWGIAPSERTKWCSQIEAKPFVAGETEYLFFVGCAGAFDNRNKQVTLALSAVLDAAGVSWGILGKEEKCCGDSLRRLGNEFVFDKMALENVEIFRAKGVTKVITQCPHCFSTLKNDYRQYGLEIEIRHHSEVIAELLEQGRLPTLKTMNENGKILFHDSCYLARHNGILSSPRQVITTATGQAPREFPRHGKESFCCGAGGGRMWMEEEASHRINIERVRQAVAEKPDTVCVACPYCLTMIEDGLKDEKDEKIRVRDIAEVVARGL